MLQFGAWSYFTSKMNLTTDKQEINMESYEPNGEWEIMTTRVSTGRVGVWGVPGWGAVRRLWWSCEEGVVVL